MTDFENLAAVNVGGVSPGQSWRLKIRLKMAMKKWPWAPGDVGQPALLRFYVLQGGKATGLTPAMPSFAQTLTPAQAGFLVDHIRTTIKHAPAAESDDSGL